VEQAARAAAEKAGWAVAAAPPRGRRRGGTGGAGGGAACDGSPLPVLTLGVANHLLLQGTIVTPDQVFVGEVLVVADTIVCVAPSCAADPQASGATIIDTQGIIMPGMIDSHNHIQFDIFDGDDWAPLQAYDDHDQWTNEDRYGAMVDAKQCLNGEASCPADLPKQALGCELVKYGELKGLIAGTTSIVGAANPADKACYGSLARTIDQGANDMPGPKNDKVQIATLFPSAASADGVCKNIHTDDDTDAYLPHVGEGKPGDASALAEFTTLQTINSTEPDGCLLTPETAIVHGTAFGDPEFALLAAHGTDLVWSPRSNVFLYGAGTDYDMTTDIATVLSYGINVSLGCDWSMGGSPNLLDEMRFADEVDEARWQILSPKDLVLMTTTNAAKVLALDTQLGALEVGNKADITVLRGDTQKPYEAILAATPREIRLVLVNGVALYGDVELMPVGPASPGCETIDVCCRSKFVCVAETGNTEKIDQTLAQIEQALSDGLGQIDAAGKTYGPAAEHWDFSPLTPLVKCGP
jgi:5-methylthioadenosine/S-adenosylhomocysteine deaminase